MKPEVKLPPRVASKPVGGMSSSVPCSLAPALGCTDGDRRLEALLRMAEQRKQQLRPRLLEPLLCDSRGVPGSDVVTKAGAGSGVRRGLRI